MSSGSAEKAANVFHMKRLLPLLLTVTVMGCTSTVEVSEQASGLARFLAEPMPAILAYRRSLTLDQSLFAIGQEEAMAKLADRFASNEEVSALLGHIQEASPSLGNGVGEIVTLATSADPRQTMDTLVLFITPTWQVTYQRLPPRPDLVRLVFCPIN